jgi:hypothetical protein
MDQSGDGVCTRAKSSRILRQNSSQLLNEQASATPQTSSNGSKITPEFIAKNLKCSPSKTRASPIKMSPCKTGKIDLIGSKKSKKNLKRL